MFAPCFESSPPRALAPAVATVAAAFAILTYCHVTERDRAADDRLLTPRIDVANVLTRDGFREAIVTIPSNNLTVPIRLTGLAATSPAGLDIAPADQCKGGSLAAGPLARSFVLDQPILPSAPGAVHVLLRMPGTPTADQGTFGLLTLTIVDEAIPPRTLERTVRFIIPREAERDPKTSSTATSCRHSTPAAGH